jgi:hypothetical protein
MLFAKNMRRKPVRRLNRRVDARGNPPHVLTVAPMWARALKNLVDCCANRPAKPKKFAPLRLSNAVVGA